MEAGRAGRRKDKAVAAIERSVNVVFWSFRDSSTTATASLPFDLALLTNDLDVMGARRLVTNPIATAIEKRVKNPWGKPDSRYDQLDHPSAVHEESYGKASILCETDQLCAGVTCSYLGGYCDCEQGHEERDCVDERLDVNSIPMSEKNIGAKNPNVIAEMMP